MRLSISLLTSAWRFCVKRCFSSFTKSRKAGSGSAGGFAPWPFGAGDGALLDAGLAPVPEIAVPSGPFTATLGTAADFSLSPFACVGLGTGLVAEAAMLAGNSCAGPGEDEAGGKPGRRAPGGTYAFCPRTTAPYLRKSRSVNAESAKTPRYLRDRWGNEKRTCPPRSCHCHRRCHVPLQYARY